MRGGYPTSRILRCIYLHDVYILDSRRATSLLSTVVEDAWSRGTSSEAIILLDSHPRLPILLSNYQGFFQLLEPRQPVLVTGLRGTLIPLSSDEPERVDTTGLVSPAGP